MYYTEELRDMDAGLLQLGDPAVFLADPSLGFNELPDNKSLYSFSCPSSCIEQYFEVCIVCFLRLPSLNM